MAEVVEAYRDYAAPCDARATVEDLLASVPSEQAGGLRRVILTNAAALTGRRKRGWSWHRGKKVRHQHVRGMYHRETRGQPASVELFVDQICGDTPDWALRSRLVRSLTFAPTFFHEVGHHIHATTKPEHREPEDVADEWKRALTQRHLRRRHPIARIVLRPLVWLARILPA
jgi:hypothetical protein